MDSTISVSKGCFVFKNGDIKSKGRAKLSKKKKEYIPLLGEEMINQNFYKTYSQTWKNMQEDIENIHRRSHSKTLDELVQFVDDAYARNDDNVLPTAALLTGINQPDHYKQFETLSAKIERSVSASVCIVPSRGCSNLKSAIENMVYSYIEEPYEDDQDREYKKLRRSQCTMQVLQAWYENEYPTKDRSLVVILPDFEYFNVDVLQDFILILSSYCIYIPIILILGVATAISVLHNTLPYHVTSKIRLQIFQTQSAPIELNEIIEKVFLSPKYAFHLSGKSFKFLVDIFLFYDFSINGFIQAFKYCMMEHFLQGNAFALCTDYNKSLKFVDELTHSDIEAIRRLLSFRPYVEEMPNRQKIISILTEDEYFKKKLRKLLKKCHIYFKIFRCFLEFLTVLVGNLPKSPMGKQLREIYSICTSSNLNDLPEFKECWQILELFSKEEFISKISCAVNTTTDFMDNNLSNDEIDDICKKTVCKRLEDVKHHLGKIALAGINTNSKALSQQQNFKNLNRQELKEKLLQMSKEEKPTSNFNKAIKDTLDYLKFEIILKYLTPFKQGAPTLYELFVFSDISSVRRNIVGAPRATLHTALNNPQFYLQCNCCELESSECITPTMPDLSIAYKLHLECGKMINLFDWLQAFRSIVDATEYDQEQIDPKIQARFTRAVAELQFLGYIKASKRKTDHVARLTW